MAVQIVGYGVAWNVQGREGRVRLLGGDGKTWNSPSLDAAQLAAYEAVLRGGASVDQGWLFSESGRATGVAEMWAASGESPFPW
jgi:hypothetical protein